MIVRRACDPIPLLIAWVRIRFREVPWITGEPLIPARTISGDIEIL
jgi:hypothetical protein